MQLERPKIQRVYVQVRDPETGRTKSLTVYGCTPEDFVDRLSKGRIFEPKPVKRSPEPSAA